MAEVPLASSGPPDSDLDIGIWTDFTTDWNRSHETEYTPRELRASLPGVTTADVAWVLAERDFNQKILVSTHLSPEQLLVEQPRLRLAGKAVGESDWLSVATASDPVGYSRRILTPGTPVDATKEELLWSSLEEILGDLASLRGSVPIRELLWVRIAQNLDELTWRETDLTADDLLSMPRYGLVRKIYADGMTEMTINRIVIGHNASVLGTDSTSTRCEYYFKVDSIFCEFLDTVCPIGASDCGLAAVNCWCRAECQLCECEGGEPENGHCFTDCCDNENNCVPSG